VIRERGIRDRHRDEHVQEMQEVIARQTQQLRCQQGLLESYERLSRKTLKLLQGLGERITEQSELRQAKEEGILQAIAQIPTGGEVEPAPADVLGKVIAQAEADEILDANATPYPLREQLRAAMTRKLGAWKWGQTDNGRICTVCTHVIARFTRSWGSSAQWYTAACTVWPTNNPDEALSGIQTTFLEDTTGDRMCIVRLSGIGWSISTNQTPEGHGYVTATEGITGQTVHIRPLPGADNIYDRHGLGSPPDGAWSKITGTRLYGPGGLNLTDADNGW
jgi:hypothetical protein